MPWLLRAGEVLASLEESTTLSSRVRGLLGRDGIDGALLIPKARSVHTLGMRFPIDVAFCDEDLRVVDIACMSRHRIGRPRRRATCVIEAEAGAFERWNLRRGDVLEVKRP